MEDQNVAKAIQLQSLLGPDADLDFCKDVLQQHNWNVEGCIDSLLGGGADAGAGAGVNVSASSNSYAPPYPESNDLAEARELRRRMQQEQEHNLPRGYAGMGGGSFGGSFGSPSSNLGSADTDLERAMRASMADIPRQQDGIPMDVDNVRATSGGTIARSYSRPTDDDVDTNFYFTILHVNETLDLCAPGDGTVALLKGLIASTTGVRASKQELLNWPTSISNTEDQLLCNLVGEGGNKANPVQLILNVGDSPAPSPGPDPALKETTVVNGDDDDEDENENDYEIDDAASFEELDSDDDIPDNYFDESPAPTRAKTEPSMMIPVGSRNPADFSNSFRHRYGEDTPRFCVATFNEALRESGRLCKPLIVYLHSDTVMETNVYCTNVLSSTDVREFLNENFVLWGWDMSHRHSMHAFYMLPGVDSVATTFSDSYPSLTSFMRPNSSLPPMKLGQLLDYNDPQTVLGHLLDMLERAQPFMSQIREEQFARQEAQLLRNEQESAYERSLRMDQAKAKAEEEAAKKREEEAKQKAEEEAKEQILKEEEEQNQVKKLSLVPPEPAEGTDGVVKIQFRCPENKKLERRFNGTDQIRHVIDFVHGNNYPPKTHAVTMSRPRRVLNNEPPEMTLADFGLAKRELLILEEL